MYHHDKPAQSFSGFRSRHYSHYSCQTLVDPRLWQWALRIFVQSIGETMSFGAEDLIGLRWESAQRKVNQQMNSEEVIWWWLIRPFKSKFAMKGRQTFSPIADNATRRSNPAYICSSCLQSSKQPLCLSKALMQASALLFLSWNGQAWSFAVTSPQHWWVSWILLIDVASLFE